MTGSFTSLVVQTLATLPPTEDATPPYVYVPFLKPLPAWNDNVWPWLLVPLCLGVAIVYKSIKCRSMRQVPKEAAVLAVWILAGMTIAAVLLGLVVEATEWMKT